MRHLRIARGAVAPVPDSQGGVRYWRLHPFEIPDDIRLQEGIVYRVLWVDGSGQPLAPTTTYVPSLRFFLGPADSAQDERDAAYAAILRDVRDPETRKKVEEEMARSRLYLQRHAFGDTTRRACWSVASDLQSSAHFPGPWCRSCGCLSCR